MAVLAERRKRRHRQRLAAHVLTPTGDVRGWHRDCPSRELPFLGTYALCLDSNAHICCYACGAHDLALNPEEE